MPTAIDAHQITIVAHDVGPIGGMESQLSMLIQGLLARGRQVTVIARSCELPDHEHLTRIRVPGSGPFPLFYPWFELTAGSLVARRRRGLVHATGAIVPNAVDVSTVHFCHHAFAALDGPSRASHDTAAHRASARISGALSRAGERLSFRPGRVRATVAISGGVRRELEHWFPALRDSLRTIPHGVDLARFAPDRARRTRARARLGLDGDALVAIFVGGDWHRKGLTHAIRAVAAAPPWRLLVVGRGDEAAHAAVARAAGAADRVRFAGPSSDTAAEFSAADAFVLPTSYETFSLVTYEAAAAGLPLLVTRVSGPDELVAQGVNGAFVDGDVERTASWLTRLADPVVRAKMGRAARDAVAPYTWDAAVDRHVELYDELAGTPVFPRRAVKPAFARRPQGS